ncbi:MAG: endonuclease/exonuclease/phosphatase family protein [Planctomycetota bacterium]
MRILIALMMCVVLLVGCSSTSTTVRFATFNTALSRAEQGQLHRELNRGTNPQAKRVAEVVQRTRPHVLVLQEIDYDPTGKAYFDFQKNYLGLSQNAAEPIAYDYVYAPPVNTGVLAPVDLDGDGTVAHPYDCYGFGQFEGNYGMVVFSQYPILHDEIVTLDKQVWADLAWAQLPEGYYSEEAKKHLRLSSKTHARVPIVVGGKTVDLIICHPTPPGFDGPEDRNGHRNRDEILLVSTMIREAPDGSGPATFVVMGDLNADPNDGSSRPGAIHHLFSHRWVNADVIPTSAGGREAAKQQGGKNLNHRSDPAADTADFSEGDRGPGNLRVDYVLPSIDLNVIGSGVYWPTQDHPFTYLNEASDHKLVWIDLSLPQAGE